MERDYINNPSLGSSGANTALSNLASVAINLSLLPGVTNSIDLGSSSYTWKDAYLSGQLKILEGGSNPTKYTIFQGGDQSVDLTYTLPVAYPVTVPGLLKSTTGGVLSWDTTQYLTSVTAHNLLSATHGDTTAHTVVRGDIITGQGSTPKWAALAFPGTPTGKILQATATDVAWSTNPLSIGTNASVSGSNTGDQTLAGLGGANAALSNLSSPAINTSLLPGVDNSIDLGSSSYVWRKGYFAGLQGETYTIGNVTGFTASYVAGTTYDTETVNYSIWAYKTILGTQFYSATPAMASITHSGPFNVHLTWSSVSGASGYAISTGGDLTDVGLVLSVTDDGSWAVGIPLANIYVSPFTLLDISGYIDTINVRGQATIGSVVLYGDLFNNIILGSGSSPYGSNAIIIGKGSRVTDGGVGIGNGIDVGGIDGIAIGSGSGASAPGGMALGFRAYVSHQWSTVIGSALSSGDFQVTLGGFNPLTWDRESWFTIQADTTTAAKTANLYGVLDTQGYTLNGNPIPFPQYCRVVQISPDYSDDDSTLEYSTIQAGLDAAENLVTGLGLLEFVKVQVHPGIYQESITVDNQISLDFDEGAFVVGDDSSTYIIDVVGSLCEISKFMFLFSYDISSQIPRDQIIYVENGAAVLMNTAMIVNTFAENIPIGIEIADGGNMIGSQIVTVFFNDCLYIDGLAQNFFSMDFIQFFNSSFESSSNAIHSVSEGSGGIGTFNDCTIKGGVELDSEDTAITFNNTSVSINDLNLAGGLYQVIGGDENTAILYCG